MNTPATAIDSEQLTAMLGYLKADPENTALLIDAAETALDARAPAVAVDLLERHARLAPLPPRARNLAGIAALQESRWADAADDFAAVLAGGEDDPALRYNLAWARAKMADHAGATEVLDDASARALPRAATLRVQLLHRIGDLDTTIAAARDYVVLFPGERALAAAQAVLAIDTGDEALAADAAMRADGHPDALATLGTLALGRDRATEALDLFDTAIARRPDSPRALIGRGLARLLTGSGNDAAADIDRGAAMFGDHLGSWIAAGWAHFVANDPATARARFDTALALDDNFAESHGSLAVLDVLAGDVTSARRRSDVALRLDRHCYSAALARSLMAAGTGDRDTARRIFDLAASTPIDGSGRTIGKALATMGLRP